MAPPSTEERQKTDLSRAQLNEFCRLASNLLGRHHSQLAGLEMEGLIERIAQSSEPIKVLETSYGARLSRMTDEPPGQLSSERLALEVKLCWLLLVVATEANRLQAAN